LPSFDSTPPPPPPPRPRPDRLLQFALVVTAVFWIIASRELATQAARGFSNRFALYSERPLIYSIFFLFLLTLGFSILQALTRTPFTLRKTLGLPRRPSAAREWALGAAIGWGGVVLAILPMTLSGALEIRFWTTPRAIFLLFLNLATLAVAALAEEVAFRGYPYQRLIDSIGPTAATIVFSLLFGVLHAFNPNATGASILVTVIAGLLFSVAWLRTHALWLGWGLHFSWNASMALLFGLPLSGNAGLGTIVRTNAFCHFWLTGGDYGPEGAALTGIVLLFAVVAVVLVSHDYAWHYTFKPIVAAGYPMEAPPPAAHVAMEQQARPAPAHANLVQILPATPQTRSVTDEPKS
jgi:uncharacterized protein